MANRVATILGIAFLLLGLLGFVVPGFLGAHLSPVHNIVHLVSGAISLWLGLKGSPSAAKTFCIVFGAVYLLLGVVGFVAGTDDTTISTGLPHGTDTKILKVIPGQLELGTIDHAIHVILGAAFLIGGFATRTVRSATARASS